MKADSPRPIARSIYSGDFTRGAAIIVFGTVGGQALVIASSPVLTRLYSPEQFGIFAVYAALLAVAILIASLRYELAIPLPKLDINATSLVSLSVFIVCAMVAITALGVAFLGDKLVSWTNTDALRPYLWALPLGVLLGGSHKVLTYWALRKKAFATIARTRFHQGGGLALSQVLLGYFNLGSLGLILGYLFGYAVGLTTLIRLIARSHFASFARFRPLRLWSGIRRYKNFPLYSTWSDMANVAGTQLPLVLFAALFSPSVAGYYMLAQRVANAPAALVSEALGKAFLANAISARRAGTLDELSVRVFSLLLRIGLCPLAVIAAIAPELFAIVFGTRWMEAGIYLQWMAPWLCAVFVFAPLSALFVVLERQRMDLLFQVVLFVSRVTGLLAGAFLYGPVAAIALFAGSAVLVYIGFGCWLLRAAGVSSIRIAQNLTKEILLAAALGTSLIIAKRLISSESLLALSWPTILFFSLAALLGAASMLRVRPALRDLAELREPPESKRREAVG